MNILTLGGGTWGITLACLLAKNGHGVRVWEFDPKVVEVLRRERRHPKLDELNIPPDLFIGSDLKEALDLPLSAKGGVSAVTGKGQGGEGIEVIVCAVPAAHVRATCRRLAGAGYAGQLFVICSKGIEENTHALLGDVALEELGAPARGRIGVLSGPSHAEEVSRDIPTAVTATAPEMELAEAIRDLFMTPRFRVYTQTDMVGVELAAALKNVIAIACGVSDGLGFGDNSKAALMTRGLSEIVRLGMKMGARQETFYGLAGIGDLVVTCMSRHSRNRNFGFHVGRGLAPEAALREVGMVVEGYYTVRAAVGLAHAHQVEMPISEGVAGVLFGSLTPLQAVSALMLRGPKSELQG
jgi:glycerol-3-phosphate dehydrogenase (NAD(P)+)